jgi:hypothetical protein
MDIDSSVNWSCSSELSIFSKKGRKKEKKNQGKKNSIHKILADDVVNYWGKYLLFVAKGISFIRTKKRLDLMKWIISLKKNAVK